MSEMAKINNTEVTNQVTNPPEKISEEENSVLKENYELNVVKAMKKKLEFCDRDPGIQHDNEKGSGDGQCIYMTADTATYEFSS